MKHYNDVLDFHKKFEVPLAPYTKLLEGEALEFRLKFLQEELDEFKKAHDEGNLEDAIDALIDLQYVLHGTAQMMGITPEQWSEHWDVVQNANMSKVRASHAGESKRGTSLDVVKPSGWVAPNHTPIIDKYNPTM